MLGGSRKSWLWAEGGERRIKFWGMGLGERQCVGLAVGTMEEDGGVRGWLRCSDQK